MLSLQGEAGNSALLNSSIEKLNLEIIRQESRGNRSMKGSLHFVVTQSNKLNRMMHHSVENPSRQVIFLPSA